MTDINAQIAIDIVKNYNQDDSERLVGITAALDAKDREREELKARFEYVNEQWLACREYIAERLDKPLDRHRKEQAVIEAAKAWHYNGIAGLVDMEIGLHEAVIEMESRQ